jgi:hypothetical protein
MNGQKAYKKMLNITREIYTKSTVSQAWWLTSVVGGGRRITVQDQPGQKVTQDSPSQQISWVWWQCTCDPRYMGGTGRRTVI